ncbi:MAG TPA: SHOCT domain-containing protein [Balneolaceae bacterium]|nr:SHOCT domain-containing protein [Balneolaceae bacterium]
MMHWMNPYGSMLMMIIWLVLIILAIAGVAKWISESKVQNTNYDSPLNILRNRYARGDISKEEFEELKKDLRQ